MFVFLTKEKSYYRRFITSELVNLPSVLLNVEYSVAFSLNLSETYAGNQY